jgi:hypothetical protein
VLNGVVVIENGELYDANTSLKALSEYRKRALPFRKARVNKLLLKPGNLLKKTVQLTYAGYWPKNLLNTKV